MYKLFFVISLFFISCVSANAYTYSLEDEKGNIIFDKKCEVNETQFNCFDKISHNGSTESRYQYSVENVYINGEKRELLK